MLSHGSLRLERERSLSHFISKGTETNWEMFGLLEFVRIIRKIFAKKIRAPEHPPHAISDMAANSSWL
jgi:hypothetical protein